MAKLQSDIYERSYFDKIWMEFYCLSKNQWSGTLRLKFMGCQVPYQLQNLKTLSTFPGYKIPHGQNFWNLIFFTWKDRVMQISLEQRSTWGNIIFIYNSYNEIVNKTVFISLKAGQKWNLMFFGKLYLTFSLV